MQLSEVLALLAGVGLVALYFKNRQTERALREAREQSFNNNLERAKKIDAQIKEIENTVLEKKEKYEKDVIEFRNRNNKPDDSSGN
jgi:hypothetical protein